MNDSDILELKKYYVYELRDPSGNDVFYVGKGTGTRARQHIGDALNSDINTAKLQRIREIHNRNQEVIIIIIGRYKTEEEAFAVESTLIKWVYGFMSLSNVVHGRRHRSIRAIKDYSEVDGIDIPRKRYSFSGEYTDGVIKQVRDNYVLEDLEELRLKIIGKIPDIEVSTPEIVNTQDPCILIRYNSSIRIQIILSKTGNQMLVMNLVPFEWNSQGKSVFKDVCDRVGVEAKSGGKYAKPIEWRNQVGLEDIDTIVHRLHEINKVFMKAEEESDYS